jgi:hypothetical protein
MATAIYWDTSALLQLYAPEADSERFRDLLRHRPERPAISFLHRVEMIFALVAKEQRGEIKLGGADMLTASFLRHCQEGHYLEIPWGEDVEQQARLALESCRDQEPPVPLRSLDGFHLGAVLAAGIPTVVSSDIRFCQAARSLGLVVL